MDLKVCSIVRRAIVLKLRSKDAKGKILVINLVHLGMAISVKQMIK